MLTILQQAILGIIQGVTEWLPISSSAFIAFVLVNFFDITNPTEIIEKALFLHLGTFLAALIYFRKDVIDLTKVLFRYKSSKKEEQKTLKFLIISFFITGIIGLIMLYLINSFNEILTLTGKTITLLVSVLLLFTGIIQIKIKNKGLRKEGDIETNDSIWLGFVQGISILPGLSRSGITISALMIKKFDDTTALRLSFLMSLPVVLIANLILNYKELTLTNTAFYGVLTSFIFGLLTIYGMMKLSKKINFGWFVLIFALIMLISLLI